MSRPNEDPKLDNPNVDGNFPALLSFGWIPYTVTWRIWNFTITWTYWAYSALPNQGTIRFAFKINEQWDSDEWRTVFFNNMAYSRKDHATGADYLMGAQIEIQMQVKKKLPGQSLLRSVSFQARIKMFCELVASEATSYPCNTTCPSHAL